MKKAKQLLENLPEPYRGQALENFNDIFYEFNSPREEPVTTTKKALIASFDWGKTGAGQGYDYWRAVYDTL